MSAPTTGIFRKATPTGFGGGGTVTDSRILSTLLGTYTKPAQYRDLQPNDTLAALIGLLDAGVFEAKSTVLQPGTKGDKGDAGIGLTNRLTWTSGSTYNVGDYVFKTSSTNSTVNSLWVFADAVPYVSTLEPKLDTGHWTELAAPAGQDGKSVELQKTATHLQWRTVSSANWTDLVTLSSIKGDAGKKVLLQKNATGTHIQYQYEGDSAWVNLIALADISGKELELQKSGTFLQWRLAGTANWNNLIPLTDITGANGKQISLQKTTTHIQMQYSGDGTNWTDLIALTDITGPAGSRDEVPTVVPLVTGTTTWAYNPNKPHIDVSVDKSTKLQPTASTGGFKEYQGGMVWAEYASAGHTLTFEGVAPTAYPDATGAKQTGAIYLFTWTYRKTKIYWTAEYLGGAGTVTNPTTNRFFAKFDNNTSLVTVANSATNNDTSGEFTIAWWAKFAASNLATPTTMLMFEKGGASGVQANVQTAGTVRMGNSSSATNTITTASASPHTDSTWRHYAITYLPTGTGVGTLTGYVNGVQTEQKTGVAAPAINTAVVSIGGRGAVTTPLGYGGYLSTLRWWKVAKTGTQVLADKNGTRDATSLVTELFASAANATDTGPLALTTTVAGGVTFGSE